MKNRKLLVNLRNEVDAFSIKPRHLERIREAFPDISLVEAPCRDEFKAGLPDAEWLMTWVFRPEWYAKTPKLEAVFTPAAGHDWAPPDSSGRVKNFYGHFHGR